ncbi:endonuclease/exonuclease/phosphatase family protein [Blastococcus sp. MG754426]|uniref:endonuclease/exonuclease/phosphatase family protein n=1 Tax=unclassified Blastococcus TaxID=2619396 RepID=UPI001EF060F3|nr:MULTISPECIES: endonuclease/exonuclease/phosphatase family protein [unclassified Blastococcus]MCF6509696.1 endonuclease/exonuclease/phosphatase family protein [Blastococcus sp. MG754426]MCF6512218.1 endonuclease/exonuclease/phosphatase family protein [Blastococcus sp. MG754427]
MAPTSARRWAVAAATPWAVWAALRRTGGERGFPLVPALAFTPYAAGTSVLPLVVALRARSRAATLLAAGAGAVLVGAVRSHRGRPPAAPPPAGRRVRIATVSLRRGLVPPEPVVDLVRRHAVDLLAVQELTPEAEQRLLAAGLAELLPHAHVVPARPGSEPAASGAVWSRLPLGARTVVPGGFEQPAVRLPGGPGPELEVASVHTRPPATFPDAVRGWAEDLAALPGPEPAVLRVLAGDFNATLDHAALRAVLRRGYLDAARAAGRGHLRTWSPLRCPVPRLGLDHVLVDPRLAVAGCDVVPVAGSDHRSVVVDLVVPGG